jgi:hypothetical protein
MPVNTLNTFNTGTDLTVTVVDLDSGASISFGGFITEFQGSANHDLITVKPIDRPTNVKRLAYGDYAVMINVTRSTGDLEDLEAKNFQDYITSGINHRYTVTASVLNQEDGSFNEYQYQNALLYVEDFGPYRKDQDVVMRVRIEAEQKIKVN